MTTPRPVQRLLVSHGLAALAMSLPWPLLMLLVWDATGDTPQGALLVGLTGAARMLPYVLLSWAAGALGDRFPRDRVLVASVAGRVALLSFVALAVAQGWLLAAVLAASAAVACGTPAFPLLAAAMPDLTGEGRRKATDILVTIEVAAFAVGPAIGGLLLVDTTRPWACAAAVGMAVAALLIVLGARIPAPTGDSAEGFSPRAVFALVAANPTVRNAILVVALLNFALGAAAVALLPMAEDVWDAGATGFGLATSFLGFGALCAPVLWWLRGSAVTRRRRGLIGLGLALLLVALAPALGWSLVPLALAGALAVLVEAAVTETIQDGVADDRRASVLGLTDSAMVGAAMLGSLLAPALASAMGARWVLILLGVAGLAAIAVPHTVPAQRVRVPQPRQEAVPTGGAPRSSAPSGR